MESNGAKIYSEAQRQKLLAWTCTQDTSNFAPNEYREVVNLSGLVVYKGQTQRGNTNVATERKSKAVNVNGVNYDAKMDLGTMTFTSSVVVW